MGFTETKALDIYYGADRIARDINGEAIKHIGNDGTGAHLATEIRFHFTDEGALAETCSITAVAKRADGAMRFDQLTKVGVGTTAYYKLEINNWYLEKYGTLLLDVKVYDGEITITDGVLTPSAGTKIIVGTTFVMRVDYVPQPTTQVSADELSTLEAILVLVESKPYFQDIIKVVDSFSTIEATFPDESIANRMYVLDSISTDEEWGFEARKVRQVNSDGTAWLETSNGDKEFYLTTDELYREIDRLVKVETDRIDDLLDGTLIAKKAEQDDEGNDIVDTYATKTELGVEEGRIDDLLDGDLTAYKAERDAEGRVIHTDYLRAGDYPNFIPIAQKGVANGVAPLGSDSKIASTYLPGYVDDVITIETATIYSAGNPIPNGFAGGGDKYNLYQASGYLVNQLWKKPNDVTIYVYDRVADVDAIYVTRDTNKTYRLSALIAGSLVEISSSLALGETSATAYAGDKGKATTDKATRLDYEINLTNKYNLGALYFDKGDWKIATESVYNASLYQATITGTYDTSEDFLTACETQYSAIAQSVGTALRGVNSAGGYYYALNSVIDNNPNVLLADEDVANVPLTINAKTGQTANLQQWKVAGTLKANIDKNGAFVGSDASLSGGVKNISTGNNAAVSVPNSGTYITRNIADTNPALKVNNLLGTLNIVEFQSATTDKAQITKDGIYNKTDVDSVVITQGGSPILSTYKNPTVVAGRNTFVGKSGNTTLGSTATTSAHASYNTGIGQGSLNALTLGSEDTAIGYNALVALTTGNANVAIGSNALSGINTSVSNVAIGQVAGSFLGDGSTPLTSSSNSVFLGVSSRANANTETNQIVIGYQAIGAGSNSVVLGNDSITKTYLKGQVDIFNGGLSLNIGGDTGANTRTNETTKYGRLTIPHYTNAEEPIALIMGVAGSSNEVRIGGGSSITNAATKISLYTGATTTTTTGTERMTIDSAGNIGIGETTPTAQLQVKSSATDKIALKVDGPTGLSTV
ncbi:MAG: hypothetical protein M0R51_09775, partial [Clostridia bacterium]|nr:hypothetical protein [Clostridia bacterium]